MNPRCAERPSGAGAFLSGLPLFRSRNGSGESDRVASGGVSWCAPDWLGCRGVIGTPSSDAIEGAQRGAEKSVDGLRIDDGMTTSVLPAGASDTYQRL